MRILIVEDRKDVQRYYVKGLKRKKAFFDVADNRIEAIELLKCKSYEGAIVDLQLIDDESFNQGIEVLKYINYLNEGTISIVVSGTPNVVDIIRSYDSGAVRVISKSDLPYSVIAEDFVDLCYNVKLNYFGPYSSLIGYLARPTQSIFFEDTFRNTIKCSYQQIIKIINKAFKKYLPILRQVKNDATSMVFVGDRNVIYGTFWSKAKGFPIFVLFMCDNSAPIDDYINLNDSEPLDNFQYGDVTIRIWRLKSLIRELFCDKIDDAR